MILIRQTAARVAKTETIETAIHQPQSFCIRVTTAQAELVCGFCQIERLLHIFPSAAAKRDSTQSTRPVAIESGELDMRSFARPSQPFATAVSVLSK
jgi:hypothetical protein